MTGEDGALAWTVASVKDAATPVTPQRLRLLENFPTTHAGHTLWPHAHAQRHRLRLETNPNMKREFQELALTVRGYLENTGGEASPNDVLLKDTLEDLVGRALAGKHKEAYRGGARERAPFIQVMLASKGALDADDLSSGSDSPRTLRDILTEQRGTRILNLIKELLTSDFLAFEQSLGSPEALAEALGSSCFPDGVGLRWEASRRFLDAVRRPDAESIIPDIAEAYGLRLVASFQEWAQAARLRDSAFTMLTTPRALAQPVFETLTAHPGLLRSALLNFLALFFAQCAREAFNADAAATSPQRNHHCLQMWQESAEAQIGELVFPAAGPFSTNVRTKFSVPVSSRCYRPTCDDEAYVVALRTAHETASKTENVWPHRLFSIAPCSYIKHVADVEVLLNSYERQETNTSPTSRQTHANRKRRSARIATCRRRTGKTVPKEPSEEGFADPAIIKAFLDAVDDADVNNQHLYDDLDHTLLKSAIETRLRDCFGKRNTRHRE